jgi:hypothetical protein
MYDPDASVFCTPVHSVEWLVAQESAAPPKASKQRKKPKTNNKAPEIAGTGGQGQG